jgi:hypothetical protein
MARSRKFIVSQDVADLNPQALHAVSTGCPGANLSFHVVGCKRDKGIGNHETEASLQNNVIQLAKLNGWMVHAERPAWSNDGYCTPIQGDAGWLDLVLAHEARGIVMVWELKSETGRVSPEQKIWIRTLKACKMDVRVYYPHDWDTIFKILTFQEPLIRE